MYENLRSAVEQWTCRNGALNIWFRDDDAVEPSRALDTLLALGARYEAPVLIATIPEHSTRALADALMDHPLAVPCIHGVSHTNHAPIGTKKTELIEGDAERDTDAVLAELRAGIEKLQGLYAERLAPILVPPWNRISNSVAARLGELPVLKAVSGFGFDPLPTSLAQMHTHVDIMNWKGGRVGHTPQASAAMVLSALTEAEARGVNAIGILSHHLVHDANAWASLEMIMAVSNDLPKVQIVDPRTLVLGGSNAAT